MKPLPEGIVKVICDLAEKADAREASQTWYCDHMKYYKKHKDLDAESEDWDICPVKGCRIEKPKAAELA